MRRSRPPISAAPWPKALPIRASLRRFVAVDLVEPSAALPATAFVAFLQNHDAVGNQPFGTRLSTRAADPALHASIAIVLLSPQIPLLFMGEEWGSGQPSCSSAILSQAWRRGARGQAQGICPFPGIPR